MGELVSGVNSLPYARKLGVPQTKVVPMRRTLILCS